MTILGAIVGGCLAAVLIALLATSGTARVTDPEGLEEFRGALAGLWPGRRKGVASHSP
jgi:hypothetical protein